MAATVFEYITESPETFVDWLLAEKVTVVVMDGEGRTMEADIGCFVRALRRSGNTEGTFERPWDVDICEAVREAVLDILSAEAGELWC